MGPVCLLYLFIFLKPKSPNDSTQEVGLNKILQLSLAEQEGSTDLQAVILRGQDNVQNGSQGSFCAGVPKPDFWKAHFDLSWWQKYPFIATATWALCRFRARERDSSWQGSLSQLNAPSLPYKEMARKAIDREIHKTQNWGAHTRRSRDKASAPSEDKNMRL